LYPKLICFSSISEVLAPGTPLSNITVRQKNPTQFQIIPKYKSITRIFYVLGEYLRERLRGKMIKGGFMGLLAGVRGGYEVY
jgi:hypothetical protein